MKVLLNPTNNTTMLRDIKFGEAFKHAGSTWIRIYNEEHDENLGNTASVVNLTTGVEAERPWDTIVEPIVGTFVETGAESENTDTANTDEILDLRERVAMLRETIQNYKDTNSELEKRINSLSDSLSDFQSSNAVNLTRAEEYSQKLGECQFINAKLREEKEKLVLEMAEINKKLQICENTNEHLREELNAKSNNCVPLVGLNAVFDFTEETIKKINDILSPIDRSLDDWEITTVGSLLQMVVSVAVDLRTLTAKLSNENSTKTLPTDLKSNLSTLLTDAGINDIDLDNSNTASLISTLVHSYVTDHITCRNLLDKCRAFADSVLAEEEPILDYSDEDLDEPTD